MAVRALVKVSWILTTAEWATAVPAAYEICMDSDTGEVFVGDGATTGANLPRIGGTTLPASYQDGDIPFVSGNGYARSTSIRVYVQPDPGTVVAFGVGQAYYVNQVLTNQATVTPDWDEFGLVISNNIGCTINLPETPPVSSAATWAKPILIKNTSGSAITISFNGGYTWHGTSLNGSLAAGSILRTQILSTYVGGAWVHELFGS